MKDQRWDIAGVHQGKQMPELPITYLLWFVGSPIMRRVRWDKCQIALKELHRRFGLGTSDIEADLIAGLRQKPLKERSAIKARRIAYRASVGGVATQSFESVQKAQTQTPQGHCL